MFKKCWFFNVMSMPCWHEYALIEVWTVFWRYFEPYTTYYRWDWILL